jgi:hypothetical protein
MLYYICFRFRRLAAGATRCARTARTACTHAQAEPVCYLVCFGLQIEEVRARFLGE